VKHNSRGIVRWFNRERGIGFATDESGVYGDVFVHRANILTADVDKYTGGVCLRHSAAEVSSANVEAGELIEYDVMQHTSGSLQAKNITGARGQIIVNRLPPRALRAQSDIDPLPDCPSGQPMSWRLTQQKSGQVYMLERAAYQVQAPTPVPVPVPSPRNDGYESDDSLVICEQYPLQKLHTMDELWNEICSRRRHSLLEQKVSKSIT